MIGLKRSIVAHKSGSHLRPLFIVASDGAVDLWHGLKTNGEMQAARGSFLSDVDGG
jgi:hypothetical protein